MTSHWLICCRRRLLAGNGECHRHTSSLFSVKRDSKSKLQTFESSLSLWLCPPDTAHCRALNRSLNKWPRLSFLGQFCWWTLLMNIAPAVFKWEAFAAQRLAKVHRSQEDNRLSAPKVNWTGEFLEVHMFDGVRMDSAFYRSNLKLKTTKRFRI